MVQNCGQLSGDPYASAAFDLLLHVTNHRKYGASVINRNVIFALWFCTLAVMASSSWCADSGAIPTSNADASSDKAMQTQVRAVFLRFVAGQNAHDRSAVSDVLVKSADFVWAQGGGQSIWGFDQAMKEWKAVWNGGWHLEPQLTELRIARVAPGISLLITPVLITSGDPGEQPSTDPIRWAGVFVRTASGWRISSLIVTPYPDWGQH